MAMIILNYIADLYYDILGGRKICILRKKELNYIVIKVLTAREFSYKCACYNIVYDMHAIHCTGPEHDHPCMADCTMQM